MRPLRHPVRVMAAVLAGWLAALGCALVVAAPARTSPAGPRLRASASGSGSIALRVAGLSRGARAQVRWRAAGARRWRSLALGRLRHATISHLRPGTAYALEVRACRRQAARPTCGRWSRAVRARAGSAPGAPGAPVPPSPAASMGQTDGPVSCAVLPRDNPINQDISAAPVDPNSAAYIASIGASGHLHPDFGSPPEYGIPYTVVGPAQPRVPITFTDSPDESDPGPYPVPPNAPVEGAGQAGDRHVLVVQNGTCKLFEMFAAQRTGAGWDAGSGAVFDLGSNALRPDGWTSADAAGLPIFPLLARYDEVATGAIDHALRFTVAHTQRAYIHPATHYASGDTDPSLPPMGLRLRLKASFDLSGFSGPALVILQALKRYGMIVADNGSNWYVSGTSDPRWDDGALDQLKTVPGSAFEVVQSGPVHR